MRAGAPGAHQRHGQPGQPPQMYPGGPTAGSNPSGMAIQQPYSAGTDAGPEAKRRKLVPSKTKVIVFRCLHVEKLDIELCVHIRLMEKQLTDRNTSQGSQLNYRKLR